MDIDWISLRERIRSGESREDVLSGQVISLDLGTYAGRMAARDVAYLLYAWDDIKGCNLILSVVGKDG